jgi:para-nitrobenzyl esterase
MHFHRKLLLTSSVLALLTMPGMAQDLTVATSLGEVAGTASEYVDGVAVFRGIRYAADAGGANRFLPPQPAPAIEGVFEANAYGNSCYGLGYPPILMEEEGADLDKSPPSEDCLFLNVWSPGLVEGKRPVMVWLHGGGFTGGSGGSIRYEASRLVSNQDVVVVTLNHRLASLGFMDVSAIGGEAYADSGNAGMLDIVQALKWVQDNISAFGGDPANVTIFGESGGGSKVTTLMSMPAAKGLFHRVIAQSGIATGTIPPEAAQAGAATVLDAAGITDVAGLQSADVTALVAPGNWGPVQSPSLPRGPFAPDADPAGAEIPLMIGSNLTEATFFNATPTAEVDADELKQAFANGPFTARIPAERIDALMDGYRAALPDTPDHEVFQVLATDVWMTQLVNRVANLRADQNGAPTYVYNFAMRQGARDGALNVPHTSEIAYAFDNLELAKALVGTPDADDQALADIVSTAWANFARNGDPNGEGVPEWPQWTDAEHAVMVFDADPMSVVDPFDERLTVLGAALQP